MSVEDPWVLGIDFGTSFTVAAARGRRGPEVIEVGGERRVPSVVLADDDGTVVVGRSAENLSTARPGRTIRAPKSRLAEPSPVVLGGRSHQVTDLVAALLSYVYVEAVRQQGCPPIEVRLTHPAAWSQPRLDRLLTAAGKAKLPNIVLVPEPVAAAVSFADDGGIVDGGFVAVYDLGGGTFDTAVLQSTAEGFVVVGRPAGEDRLGGDLFDELLANHVGSRLDPETWEALQVSDEQGWQQAAAALRSEARRVKEALSSHPYAELLLGLPTGMVSQRVTRDEFEALVEPYVASSVELLSRAVGDAGLSQNVLDAVYLAGGASRSPVVERLVSQAFPGVTVSRRGDPKTAVALGATHGKAVPTAPGAHPVPPPPSPNRPSSPPPSPSSAPSWPPPSAPGSEFVPRPSSSAQSGVGPTNPVSHVAATPYAAGSVPPASAPAPAPATFHDAPGAYGPGPVAPPPAVPPPGIPPYGYGAGQQSFPGPPAPLQARRGGAIAAGVLALLLLVGVGGAVLARNAAGNRDTDRTTTTTRDRSTTERTTRTTTGATVTSRLPDTIPLIPTVSTLARGETTTTVLGVPNAEQVAAARLTNVEVGASFVTEAYPPDEPYCGQPVSVTSLHRSNVAYRDAANAVYVDNDVQAFAAEDLAVAELDKSRQLVNTCPITSTTIDGVDYLLGLIPFTDAPTFCDETFVALQVATPLGAGASVSRAVGAVRCGPNLVSVGYAVNDREFTEADSATFGRLLQLEADKLAALPR